MYKLLPERFTPMHQLVLIYAATILLFWKTWLSLFNEWLKFDQAYSHGFLVLCLAGCSIYKRKHELLPSNSNQTLAYFLLLGSIGSWVISETLTIQITSQLLLSFILILSTATLMGWRPTRSLLVPYSLFLLAIPVWQYFVPTLQSLTTYISSLIITFIEIPAYIQGNFISIPYGTFEVAGGCSGIRYILISIALTIFWTEDSKFDIKAKLPLVILALIVGMIANWIRVSSLILIGYYSEMQHELVKDHEFFGWIIFACVMVPFFFILHPHSGAKETVNEIHHKNQSRNPNKHFFLTLFVLSLAPMLQALVNYTTNSYSTVYVYSHQSITSEWLKSSSTSNWQLDYLKPDSNQTVVYKNRNNHDKITVSSAFYGKEIQGVELVGYENHIASPKLWDIRSLSPVSLTKDLKVSRYIITNKLKKQKLVYGFYLLGEFTAHNQSYAKLAQLQSLYHPSIPKGFVAFAIDCKMQCEAQEEILGDFIPKFIEQIKLEPVVSD